jgi:hypothetical protein
MPDLLTAEAFDAYLGQPFDILYGNDQRLQVVLVKVERSRYQPGDQSTRQGFALTFQSSIREYLTQGTYPISSPAFDAAHGALEIFIVPLAPNAEGIQYEAIFN